MDNFPKVSIITINYNQSNLTIDLINSIKDCRYKNVEIIVVDNASKEDISILQTRQDIMLIKSKKNLGFAGGNNVGIKQATGEFLFFVNNDTIFTQNLIHKLVNLLQANPDVGIVSPKIIYYHSPNYIQYAGMTTINKYTGRNRTIGKNNLVNKSYYSGYTAYAHGAAMMVPKKILSKIGLMPENYFLYYEELDWCETIKKNGFKVYFLSEAEIFHKESKSIGKNSDIKEYYLFKNRIIFMRRNFPGLKLYMFFMYISLLVLPVYIINNIRKKQFKHTKSIVFGYWNGLNAKI